MMLTATAAVEGWSEGPIMDRLKASISVLVDRAAEAVFNESQILVPTLSGELKDSGKKSAQADTGAEITGGVEYSAPHCMFVEFGTGLAGMGTYPYPLPQEGVPITGSWIYDYRGIGWRGMAAQPYLRPALDSARTEVLTLFGGLES